MSIHDLNVVRKEVRIQAPLDRVWEAWTEPDRISQWFADSVEGWPGVGSTLSMTWEKFGFTVDYKIAELEPRKRIVLKTRLPGVGTQVLTVEMVRRAPETIVTVTESGPENHKSDPRESGVESGWVMACSVLKHYVENYFGEPRRSFFAFLPASFTYERFLTLLTTPEGLASWLTREGSVSEVGQPYSLTLDNGNTMSGRVLALTHHEMALGWDEIRGFLEFKSFPLGRDGQKALCLRGSGYSLSQERADELEQFVKDSMVKLFAAVAVPADQEASAPEAR